MNRPNIIATAFESGIVQEDVSRGRGWSSMRPRIESMLEKVDGRVTLFIGAAASSFEPTCFPAWDRFIQLIYESQIDLAASDLPLQDRKGICDSLKDSISRALSWDNPSKVANYKFTEAVARRLGKDYLSLLKAFRAHHDGAEWIVNHAHKWAAACLMNGDVAAVVTTNFDDCIERALENQDANVYTLTGNAHIDGNKIVTLMSDSSRRLVLVVSGPRACLFAQSLLPQVGESISLLFKLHGSCYFPESCIDTRLQRQQGLPSYAVDILDILITRSVFFVTCFSGGDLNDNVDYLRMIHNKKKARVVWLQRDIDQVEPGVAALARALPVQENRSEGLCFIHGSFQGTRLRWDEDVHHFQSDILEWSRNVGVPWSKLLVLDLLELCSQTSEQSEALERLGFVGSKRQDWNRVVENDLTALQEQPQYAVAYDCQKAAETLQAFLRLETDDGDGQRRMQSQFPTLVATIRDWHLTSASRLSSHQPHAQGWVISALYGVLLYCQDHSQAAGEIWSFAQSAAFLVGDFQSSEVIGKLIRSLDVDARPLVEPESLDPDTEAAKGGDSVVAFIPALDNVGAKANQYGAPPALFVRALLHRAMLFADKIAVLSNVMTNSSVFVNEILFAGKEERDDFYLSFLRPVIVHGDSEAPRTILDMFKRSHAQSDYISEGLTEAQMGKLDEYFLSRVEGEDASIHFSQTTAAQNYLTRMRRACTELRAFTKEHLIGIWRRRRLLTTEAAPDVQDLDDRLADEMADTMLDAVSTFTQHLNGPLTRSKLYNFAGLFTTVLNDQQAIFERIKYDISLDVRDSLVTGRAKLLARPWISGPLCHELFDVLYNWNPIVNVAANSESGKSIVFLEEHEQASSRFMEGLVSSEGDFKTHEDTVAVGQVSEISGLLLGQASEHDIVKCREALAPVRRRLALNGGLDEQSRAILSRELKIFKRNALDVDYRPEANLVRMSEEDRIALLDFLRHCVFLIRKGEPLDRMYEEPRFTLPGASRFERT